MNPWEWEEIVAGCAPDPIIIVEADTPTMSLRLHLRRKLVAGGKANQPIPHFYDDAHAYRGAEVPCLAHALTNMDLYNAYLQTTPMT